MALPTSFAPAVQRIYEVLTTSSAGGGRPLADERLFLKLASRRADADIAAQSIAQKRCMVVLRDLAPARGPEMQPSNRLRYEGVVEITRSYKAGHDLMSDEMERARLLGSDDTHYVRAALCYPGALTETLLGDATGIDGGALDAIGARTVGPTPTSHALVWVDVYPIRISLEWS